MIASGGAVEVGDAAELAHAVQVWLSKPETLEKARRASSDFVSRQENALEDTIETICEALNLRP